MTNKSRLETTEQAKDEGTLIFDERIAEVRRIEDQKINLRRETSLDQVYANLKASFLRLRANENFDDFAHGVADAMADGLSYDEIEGKIFDFHFQKKGRDVQLIPIRISIANCVLAKRAFDCGKNREAYLLIDRAIYYSDMVSEHVLEGMKQQAINLRRAAAIAGGRGKSEKYRPIKNELIRLLHENRPPDGWDSISTAFSDIEMSLSRYNAANGDIVADGALLAAVLRWAKTEPVRSAFDACVLKRKGTKKTT